MTISYDQESLIDEMARSFDDQWGAGGWSWTATSERRDIDGVEYVDVRVCAVIERKPVTGALENRLVWPVKKRVEIRGGDYEAAGVEAIALGRAECARQWATIGDGKNRHKARAKAAAQAKPPSAQRFRADGRRGNASRGAKPKLFRFRRGRK